MNHLDTKRLEDENEKLKRTVAALRAQIRGAATEVDLNNPRETEVYYAGIGIGLDIGEQLSLWPAGTPQSEPFKFVTTAGGTFKKITPDDPEWVDYE